MVNIPKPEVIVTHESDLDGFVSGLLLRKLAAKLFGADVRLEAYNNNTWRQRALPEQAAWVSDLSFDPRIDKPGWLVVDHHTNEAVPRFATLIHDAGKSSALLCYELCCAHGLQSPALDRLAHLANIADLFQSGHADFALASDYASLIKTYQFWTVYDLISGDLERLLDHPLLEVVAVKRRVEDPLGFAWSAAHVEPLSATVGCVEVLVGNANLIVHRLLVEGATPYPVLLTLARKGGAFSASLRSRNGEALKVAQRLQGGGHPNAAGASLPRSIQHNSDAIDYLKKVLNPELPPDKPLQSLASLFEGLNPDRE
jgi:hypothetical protein